MSYWVDCYSRGVGTRPFASSQLGFTKQADMGNISHVLPRKFCSVLDSQSPTSIIPRFPLPDHNPHHFTA